MACPPLCIVDANILIDLWNGRVLEPLFALPYAFATPDVIFEEELIGVKAQLLAGLGLTQITLSGEQVLEVAALRSQHRPLSVNDLFAFIAARDRDAILLTGDRLLRRLAKDKGVMVHGTLWVLDELVRLSIVLAANASCILERMLDTGSRFPDAECERRLALWTAAGTPGDYRESDE